MATLLPLYAETLSRGELSHEWKGKAMPDVYLAQQQFVRYPFQAESVESLHGWARAHDAKASQSQWVRAGSALCVCMGAAGPVRAGAGPPRSDVYRYGASDKTASWPRCRPRPHLPRAPCAGRRPSREAAYTGASGSWQGAMGRRAGGQREPRFRGPVGDGG